jgi:hypothetical protein
MRPEEHSRQNQQDHRAEQRRRLQESDDQVLTFLEWCLVNSISPATGRRIKKSGNGPEFIQLSERRLGVTMGANRKWRAGRAR